MIMMFLIARNWLLKTQVKTPASLRTAWRCSSMAFLCRCSMVLLSYYVFFSLWCFYGFTLVCLMFVSYGSTMVLLLLWFSKVLLWFYYCLFYGFTLVLRWFYYGFDMCCSMFLLWFCYGVTMVLLFFTLALLWWYYCCSMVLLWLYYGFSMVVLFFYHGFTMFALCFLMVWLWFV